MKNKESSIFETKMTLKGFVLNSFATDYIVFSEYKEEYENEKMTSENLPLP